MSRITDLMAIEYIARSHCADPTCQKCSARARWLRRKGWRTNKTSTRKAQRKEVMHK
jgi:hypothetical protein